MTSEVILITGIGFILGTILGSFIKVLADRSLLRKKFSGRSYCPACKHKLYWLDLWPLLSFILLKGKCRYCGDKIGVEYLLVEMVTGVLIGYLFWQNLPPFVVEHVFWNTIATFQGLIFVFDLILKIFFISILAALFLTDLKKMLIPDRIIIPAIILGIIGSGILTIFKIGYLYFYLSQNFLGKYLLPPYSDFFRRHAQITAEPFLYSVLTALLIAGFFLSLIIITRGKGMGGGDVKLGAFIGLMLGFPHALVAIILSFFIGAIFSLFLIFSGKKRFGQTIAFGPFLVLGALITLFWGEQIVSWYLGLIY